MIGALLAAESGPGQSYPETVVSVAIGLGVYWLAHSYSNMLGERLIQREHLTARSLLRALGHDGVIVRGAGMPLIALLIAWAAGASHETGVTVAIWTAIGCIILFELLAGVNSFASPAELVLEVAVGVGMGLAILGLKALAH